MIAFEVFINGHRICLAGVGNDGVLNAIVTWVGRPNSEEEIFLRIGGLHSITDEHSHWNVPSIGAGAEILVKVVEADSVDLDPPDQRYRSETPTTLEQYRDCLKQFTERLTEDERKQLQKELIADLQVRGQQIADHLGF
jgi:hypothetical protein